MGNYDYQNALAYTLHAIYYTPVISNKADKLKSDLNSNKQFKTQNIFIMMYFQAITLYYTSKRLKIRRSLHSETFEGGCSFKHKI